MFTHYLVTRFNLRNKQWTGSQGLQRAWLEERFALFEKYCLPSVKNQSETSFVWLVFFDVNTPQTYVEKAQVIAADFPCFTPLFIDGFDALESFLTQYIKEQTKTEFIITTRLDNDDLLHRDFIKTLQAHFHPKQKVIDIRKGYQMILSPNALPDIRSYHLSFNPFISIVNRADESETCLSREHTQWRSANNIDVVCGKELWIQLIHGGNKLNRKITSLKKTANFDPAAFGLRDAFPNPKWTEVLLHNARTSLARLINNIRQRLRVVLKSVI